MPNIAIFASGAGSNAREIIRYFHQHPTIKISLVACNKAGAGVIDVAASAGIPCFMINKDEFFKGDACVPFLKQHNIDLVVLAGFLWKIPLSLIEAFPHKIINIHPALLPAYGGKGMYGEKIHESVLLNNDKQSGITVHYVDELYDHGQVIFQKTCDIEDTDTPDSLAEKVHQLEHRHYPRIIEELLQKMF
ncbi:MAG: phosphoribosylglycinamide formyltransferase [Chitinophagaceae bacterium]